MFWDTKASRSRLFPSKGQQVRDYLAQEGDDVRGEHFIQKNSTRFYFATTTTLEV